MLKPFSPKDIFPPKAAQKPVIKGQKIALISNHFPVAFPNPKFKAVEWNFTVVNQAQLADYLANPASHADAVVAQDNRKLIDSVLYDFRREIARQFSPHFTSGASLYCFKNVSKKEVVISGGRKNAIVFRMTPNSVSLDSLVPSGDSRMKLLQVLNSQVKYIFKGMGFLELGFNKKYYDPKLTETFEFDGSRFMVLKGFGAVFEAYEAGLMLQLDYSTRVLADEDLWTKIKKEIARTKWAPARVCEEVVNNRSFMTTYGNQKLVIIDKPDLTKNPLSAFPNPAYKNYKDYFERRYNITIKDDEQFLLVKNTVRKEYDEAGNVKSVPETTHYVPELLKAEGIPDQLRKNFKFMQNISSRAILPPAVRFQKTKDMVATINSDKNKAVDFHLEKDQNKVSGYRLDPPRILSDSGAGFVPNNDRLRINRLAEKRDFLNWVLIYDAPSEAYLKCVLHNLGKVAGMYKFGLKDPRTKLVVTERSKLDDVMSKVMKGAEKPDFVLIFTNRRTCGALYKELKRRFNTEGVLTQFFSSFNPNKDEDNIAKYANIVNQIQAKLGSNLWLVENDLVDTLVLGADVYHSRGNKSVASLVGQFGKNLRHTYTCTSMQSSSYEEVIGSMTNMFLEILEYYLKVEKKMPEKVLFYRDGVGQSFIEHILKSEVSGIIAAMEKKYTLKRPRITVVLVTKRISDKLATADPTPNNPPPGTVVESGISHPEHTSFLLVAQKVTQGSANPTKYQLVYDENDTNLDDLLRLTHNLCWGYFNWLGPVKVPAPVQYAHKSCYLFGELQEAKINANIKNKLHFL